jgi:hypothetical protein
VGEYTRDIAKTDRLNYSQFINYISKGEVPNSVEFITAQTLDHRIRNGDISDSNNNGMFEDRSILSSEITAITKQIDDRKKELRNEKIPKSKWDDDQKLQELYKIRDEKQKLVGGVETNNTQALIQQIDNLDADGKKFKLEV